MQYYDLIGDIHGHADELIKLLTHLGYQQGSTGYQHPSRKVIFLGDFIDRGEHLAQHRPLLDIVMTMVNNGHALAVMGNHEFNALAFHTMHNGQPIRPHTQKNIKQHRAFLNEYEKEPEMKQQVLDFFFSLPLWLELNGLRVIHACWDDCQINVLKRLLPKGLVDTDTLVQSSIRGTEIFNAIEVLLKGVEVKLPEGITFNDKDGHSRDAVRVQWWKRTASHLHEVALPFGVEIGDAGRLPLPESIPVYAEGRRPCFIGHYWLHGEPEPLAGNVACLDYSVAKEGKLVAYRWSGEQVLQKENFTHV